MHPTVHCCCPVAAVPLTTAPLATLHMCREVHGGGGPGVGIPGFQPGLPLFIAGISLGGCIAFHAILRDQQHEQQLFRWRAGAAAWAGVLAGQ